MSFLTVTAINVLNNPAPFTAPLEFEVHYEAILDLEEDVEWKMVYVGSADDQTHDQELESVMVGPVTQGKYKFVFQADPPDPLKIPKEDLVGLTAVLLCCSYHEQEFLRVGYYVQVNFEDESLIDDPPANPSVEQLQRNVLEEDPRITHYAIDLPKHLQIPENDSPEVLQELNRPIEGSKSLSEREGEEDQEEEEEDEEEEGEEGEEAEEDEREGEEDDASKAHSGVLNGGAEAALEVELLG